VEKVAKTFKRMTFSRMAICRTTMNLLTVKTLSRVALIQKIDTQQNAISRGMLGIITMNQITLRRMAFNEMIFYINTLSIM